MICQTRHGLRTQSPLSGVPSTSLSSSFSISESGKPSSNPSFSRFTTVSLCLLARLIDPRSVLVLQLRNPDGIPHAEEPLEGLCVVSFTVQVQALDVAEGEVGVHAPEIEEGGWEAGLGGGDVDCVFVGGGGDGEADFELVGGEGGGVGGVEVSALNVQDGVEGGVGRLGSRWGGRWRKRPTKAVGGEWRFSMHSSSYLVAPLGPTS